MTRRIAIFMLASVLALAQNPVSQSPVDKSIVVPLTLDQMLNLFTVPVQIVPAQGAGSVIEISSCYLNYVYAGVAMTSGGNITIGYGSTTSTVIASIATTVIASTVFVGTASAIAVRGGVNTILNSSLMVNAPISMVVQTANFAGGTGASGSIQCTYRVHYNFQ